MSANNLAGCLQVLAQLLDEGCAIVANIEPESTDESRRLAVWLDQASRAVHSVRSVTPAVDIDAAHYRLTGD